MNMYNLKNNKLGMTLVEMVISLLILSILMTSTMGIIISSNSIFISTSKAALDRQIGNGVYDTMESILKYATELYITDTKPTESKYTEKYKKYIYLTDVEYYDESSDAAKAESASGHIIYEKSGDVLNLYESGYYKGRTVQYSVIPVGSNGTYLRLTVYVVRDGEVVYKRSATINCLNLTADSTRFNTNASVKYNPCLCYNSDYDPSSEDSAWYLEYKAAQFMAKYNKILSEYYDKISPVYEEYKNTLVGTDEDGNYISARNAAGQISYKDFASAKSKFNKAIFGTSGDPVSTNVNSKTQTVDFTTVGDLDGTVSKGNLRLYYQKQIYDLLGFTPTRAFKDFTETQNVDNPYYGVAATKEELYYGFLLKNYDGKGTGGEANGIKADGQLTKNEYPGLPSYYYDGTIFKSGYEDSDGNKYNYNADDMVILGYFYDNTNDTYNSALFDATADKTRINWYTSTNSLKVDGIKWAATSTWQPSVEKSSYHPDKGEQTCDTYHYSFGWPVVIAEGDLEYNHKFTASTFDITDMVGPDSGDAFYTIHSNRYYTVDSDATGSKGISDPATSLTSLVGYTEGEKFATSTLASKLTATELNSSNCTITGLETNNVSYKTSGSITFEDKYLTKTLKVKWPTVQIGSYSYDHVTIGITPNSDLPEGWYYVSCADSHNSENTNYYYFYLKANSELSVTDDYGNAITSKVAVLSGSNYTYKDGQYAIYLSIDDDVGSLETRDNLFNISYQQAQMSAGTGGKSVTASGFSDVTFHTINKHQYIDWQLYQVDWNTWFTPKATTTGITNSVIGAFNNVVNYFTGATEAAADISYVDYTTAEKVLGVTGCNNVTIGTSRHLRSYNAAAVVYDSSRSTWYYLPDTSSKLSQAMDKLPTSSKDAPIFIDVEFATSEYHTSSDRQYANSKAISADISNRKLSATAVWGLVDAATDVIWTALPASSEGINRMTLSMPGVTLDPTFKYNQKTYTATTSSASSSILASFISNEYTTSDIHILVKVNGQEVDNGSAVNWNVGTNTVTIDVYKIKSRNIITSKITSEKLLSDYSGYNITVNYTPAS